MEISLPKILSGVSTAEGWICFPELPLRVCFLLGWATRVSCLRNYEWSSGRSAAHTQWWGPTDPPLCAAEAAASQQAQPPHGSSGTSVIPGLCARLAPWGGPASAGLHIHATTRAEAWPGVTQATAHPCELYLAHDRGFLTGWLPLILYPPVHFFFLLVPWSSSSSSRQKATAMRIPTVGGHIIVRSSTNIYPLT